MALSSSFFPADGAKITAYASNNTYKSLRVISEKYDLTYTVWCSNEHELYEMQDVASVFKDAADVLEAGRQFAEAERGKLLAADVTDKAEAKEKKREKKRKRKAREREVRPVAVCRARVC